MIITEDIQRGCILTPEGKEWRYTYPMESVGVANRNLTAGEDVAITPFAVWWEWARENDFAHNSEFAVLGVPK